MYRKMVIALIVVGSLVIGYTSFGGSLAQASHNCGFESASLAANPELAVACRYHDVATGAENSVPGAIEAGMVRSTDLTSSTYLAANPELNLVRRYTDAVGRQTNQPATFDLEKWNRFHHPGR